MTTHEYIQKKVGEENFYDMIKKGIISFKLGMYYQVYTWHLSNGKSEAKTAEHFHMPTSSVSYARQQMKKQI